MNYYYLEFTIKASKWFNESICLQILAINVKNAVKWLKLYSNLAVKHTSHSFLKNFTVKFTYTVKMSRQNRYDIIKVGSSKSYEYTRENDKLISKNKILAWKNYDKYNISIKNINVCVQF